VQAVDGITFSVGRGEVYGLLGPNGAGKTTTVEMLEGLQAPDSGEVRVLGFDTRKSAVELKRRIGVQLQTAALYPQLTVEELLSLFATFYPRRVASEGLLATFGLEEKRTTQTKHLSGGQRQRLSVALALVNDPEVVFLDEPTTGLDPAARRSLWTVIERLRSEGRSVLLTTHYLEEAEVLCDHVAVMDHGRILDSGTVDELIGRRFRERAIQFDTIAALSETRLTTLPAVSRVAGEDGSTLLYTTDVAATIGGLLAAADDVGAELGNLVVRRATLEDVFLDLTGRALRD
jgi:ABC-2 type transport system ATP-binding protein